MAINVPSRLLKNLNMSFDLYKLSNGQLFRYIRHKKQSWRKHLRTITRHHKQTCYE